MSRIHNRKLQNYLQFYGTAVELLFFCILYYVICKFEYSSVYSFYYGRGKYVLVGLYAFIMFFALKFSDGLQFGQLKFTEIFVSQILSILVVNFATYFQLSLIADEMIYILPFIYFSLLEWFFALVLTYLYTLIYHSNIVPSSFLLIYGSRNAVDIKIKADRRGKEFNVTKIINSDEDLDRICEEIVKYEAVIINDVPNERRNDILKFCFSNDVIVYIVPKISDIILKSSIEINLFDTPLYFVNNHGISTYQAIVKRAFDFAVSLLAIIILSPVFLVTAVMIKLEDGGPVFYKQKRVTKNGKIFEILKFRSMIVDAEKEGIAVPATDHDPRITKVGHVIRACRIDELPQLFNILEGSMSIVGPRPERIEHVEKYKKEIPEFSFREKVKGGLTGYAQVFGKYNTSAYDKIRLDLIYIENYSFLLDLKLIILTIRVLFQKESTEGFNKTEELKKEEEALSNELEN